MKIQIIKEAGIEEALYGLGLSYGLTSDISYDNFINDIKLFDRVYDISKHLYKNDGGHNKFLESIHIYIKIQAPRYWWSEADTYRLSSKQSESTMHTLTKRDLTQNDFEYEIPNFYLEYLNGRAGAVLSYNIDIDILKNCLPEGFLQTRIWNISYKTLRNIIQQRHDHKLPQWRLFCDYMINNVTHSEYFEDLKGE